jgi:hypothetical protein
MSSLSQFGSGGRIKSKQEIVAKQVVYIYGAGGQRGVAWTPSYLTFLPDSTSIDITINPVNIDKTILIYNLSDGVQGFRATQSNAFVDGYANVTGNTVTLLNSTTIRVSGPLFLIYNSAGGQPAFVNIQVVEFY